MADPIRCLNEAGVAHFKNFVTSLRAGTDATIPYALLTSEDNSFPLETPVSVERKSVDNWFEFGRYLQHTLKPLNRRDISLKDGLWNWLALYYFDELCPKSNGKLKPLDPAVYILSTPFNYQRYYRHLVRTPWLAVSDHGNFAKVLLATQASHSEIAEQLGANQDIFGNPKIIASAYKLYFDETTQKPKRGAAGKGAGSARRLRQIIRQLSLTYDLQGCTSAQFLQLLPKEFDKFKIKTEESLKTSASKPKGWKKLLNKLSPSTPAGGAQNI
jgi:hypothetical protein